MKINSSSLPEKTKAFITEKQLYSDRHKLLLAVSGGADSMAMLHLLSHLHSPKKLRALYIDHCLRPAETKEEIALVQKLCTDLGIAFHSDTVDTSALAQQEKLSLEDAARRLRYAILERYRFDLGLDKIAIAHNADDQVEEFFLRLIRGTALRGLSGMLPSRGRVIRPVLFARRNEIEIYLEQQKISWATDSSNQSRRFLRNRVRMDLLPTLEDDFNPSIRRRILETMDILAEEEAYLAEKTRDLYEKTIKTPDGGEKEGLSLDGLLLGQAKPALQRRVVEKALIACKTTPSYQAIIRICQMLATDDSTGRTTKEIHLPDGLRMYQKENFLFFTRQGPEHQKSEMEGALSYLVEITRPGCYSLPGLNYELAVVIANIADQAEMREDYLIMDAEKAQLPLTVRPAEKGERLTLCNGPTKKIFRYYNEKKLSKRLRSVWPVVVSKNSVAAIAGYGIGDDFKVDKSTRKILGIRLV